MLPTLPIMPPMMPFIFKCCFRILRHLNTACTFFLGLPYNHELIVPDHQFLTPDAIFLHFDGYKDVARQGGGKVDTCLDINVISADFFHNILAPAGFLIKAFDGPDPVFCTINNIPINAVGILTARLKIVGSKWPAKYMHDIQFYILEKPIRDIDFLIGSDTFKENFRVVPVGAPAQGLILPPPQISSESKIIASSIAAEAIAAEEKAWLAALDANANSTASNV